MTTQSYSSTSKLLALLLGLCLGLSACTKPSTPNAGHGPESGPGSAGSQPTNPPNPTAGQTLASAPCPADLAVYVSLVDFKDVVGLWQEGSSGTLDAQFGVSVMTASEGNVITYMRVDTVAADGSLAGQAWDTKPNSAWYLGVYMMNGQMLNSGTSGLAVAAPEDVYAYAEDMGYFESGQRLLVTAALNNDMNCQAQTEITIP
jgi:hypothetical protein